MADRHKVKPKAVRMPDGLLAWYQQHAETTGRRVNAVLVGALQEYRERTEGGSTSAVAPPAPAPVVAALPEQPQQAAKSCKHRNMRMAKGICPDCHQPVGYR